MKTLSKIIFSLLIIFTFSSAGLTADSDNQSALGFEFGMSDGAAEKLIKNNGRNIIKNEKDSKDVRTIIFDGVLVEVTRTEGLDQKTRLEFFRDKLMSSAVMIKANDDLQLIDVQGELIKQLISNYGEPHATDKMFSYETWEWDVDQLGLILSVNRDKGKIKLEYTYNPVATTKLESELNLKRKGEVRSPAEKMFIDGNFSQQGGPGNKRF